MPMGDELKWLLKEGGGRIFVSCDIFLKIRSPHMQLVYPLLFAHAVILQCLLSCACLCAITAIVHVCLHAASSVLLV